MVRGNKFLRFEDIELKKLYVGKSNFRTENVNEGIEELMDHIYVNDLLETIVVYAVDDLKEDNDMLESRKDKQGKGLFEILAGQRRFAAFKMLDKAYPKEGFEKIPCHVRQPPDDELDAKAISIGENLTQLPVTLADAIDACDVLFKKYGDEKIVAKRYGISENIIKKYVKFARLPKILQDKVVGVIKIPLDEIDEDCDSARTSPPDTLKDLIEHIAQHGLLEPIVVCKSGNGKYEILAGHRRYCAYVMLNKNHPGEGWDKIPARSRGDCGGIEDTPTMNAR